MSEINSIARYKYITPKELNQVAILPQGIDNVWAPQHLLKSIIGKGLSLEDVADKIEPYVKKEWRRALLYGDQVVINRAFLYNTKAVYADFIDPYAPNTVAFGKLLDTSVIIPFLYTEEPDEPPKHFAIDNQGWEAWKAIGGSNRATFVRLAKEKNRNKEASQKMGQVYRFYLRVLTDPETGPLVFEDFIGSKAAARECYSYFKGSLNRLEKKLDNQNAKKEPHEDLALITRETLYDHFIWKSIKKGRRVSPLKRKFSPEKKFSNVLKQIFDLKYSVNSPDFLDRYALTAQGTPRRALLRDYLSAGIVNNENEITIDDFQRALKRLVFDTYQQGLYLNSLGSLELPDILAIRSLADPYHEHDTQFLKPAQKSWENFIESQRKLLDNPLEFPEIGRNLFLAFIKLNQSVTGLIKPRLATARYNSYHPLIKFSFEVPGIITVVFPLMGIPEKTIPFAIIESGISGAFGKVGSKLIGRLIVSYFANRSAKSDLELSITFMERRLEDAINEWPKFIHALKKDKNFRQVHNLPEDKSPTINYEEEFQGEPE